MKLSNFISKHWRVIFIYPIIVAALFFISCDILNFLLVPVKNDSVIEVVMNEAKEQEENIDVIFFGSSRTYRGINSCAVSESVNKNVFNIAYQNASFFTDYYLLEEICEIHNPEMIFIEISTANFFREKSTEDIYAYQTLTGERKTKFLKESSLKYHDLHLLNFTNYMENFSNEKYKKNVSLKRSKVDNKSTIIGGRTTYYGKGYWCSDKYINENKYLSLPLDYGAKNAWKEKGIDTGELKYFKKIIEFCQEHSIKINLFSPPFPITVAREWDAAFSGFDVYISENFLNGDIVFVDFAKTKKPLMMMNNTYFYDGNHLNRSGADALAPVVSSVLSDLLNESYDSNNYFYDTFAEMIVDYEE